MITDKTLKSIKYFADNPGWHGTVCDISRNDALTILLAEITPPLCPECGGELRENLYLPHQHLGDYICDTHIPAVYYWLVDGKLSDVRPETAGGETT